MNNIKLLQSGKRNHLYITDENLKTIGVQKELSFVDSVEDRDRVEIHVTFIVDRKDFRIYHEDDLKKI